MWLLFDEVGLTNLRTTCTAFIGGQRTGLWMTEFPFYSLNLLFFYFPFTVFKTQSFFSWGIISPPVISNDPSILCSLSCNQSSPFDHSRKRPALVKTISVKPRLNCDFELDFVMRGLVTDRSRRRPGPLLALPNWTFPSFLKSRKRPLRQYWRNCTLRKWLVEKYLGVTLINKTICSV